MIRVAIVEDDPGYTRTLEEYLNRSQINVIKKTKKGEKEIDIRPLFSVVSLKASEGTVLATMRFATGIELRFTMPDGAVDLLLKTIPQAEAATAHIFFGSFQGGWEYSSKNIGA